MKSMIKHFAMSAALGSIAIGLASIADSREFGVVKVFTTFGGFVALVLAFAVPMVNGFISGFREGSRKD